MNHLTQRISEQLLGERCHDIRFVEGGILILYFGPRNEQGRSPKRLWIDCAFRIGKERVIQAGSLDDPQHLLKFLRQLPGLVLEALSVAEVSGDLRLTFAQGVVIETFGHYSDELWEFRRADGLRVGLGPSFQPFERMAEADR